MNQVPLYTGTMLPDFADPTGQTGYAVFVKTNFEAGGVDVGLYFSPSVGIWRLHGAVRALVPIAVLGPEGSTKIVNLSDYTDIRTIGRVANPGPAGSTCKAQWATNAGGPWTDIGGTVSCATVGPVNSAWAAIAAGAKAGDIILRLLCSNPAPLPEFEQLYLQVR